VELPIFHSINDGGGIGWIREAHDPDEHHSANEAAREQDCWVLKNKVISFGFMTDTAKVE
jgi:hypothetical protein